MIQLCQPQKYGILRASWQPSIIMSRRMPSDTEECQAPEWQSSKTMKNRTRTGRGYPLPPLTGPIPNLRFGIPPPSGMLICIIRDCVTGSTAIACSTRESLICVTSETFSPLAATCRVSRLSPERLAISVSETILSPNLRRRAISRRALEMLERCITSIAAKLRK